MLEIVICSSDRAFTGMFEVKLKDFYACRDCIVSVWKFPDGQSFMHTLDDDHPMDLLFLNTKLADMSGFVVADLVRLSATKKDCKLIFVGSREDVFQSFFYQPLWYIREQYWEEDLEKALNRLWVIDHRERSLLIHEGRSTCCVRIERIQLIVSDGHYLCLQCEDRSYRIRGSMVHYEELLQDYYFAHPSKSCMVNCAYVEAVSDKILMKDGSRINYSKGKKAEVKRMVERYMKEIEHCL